VSALIVGLITPRVDYSFRIQGHRVGTPTSNLDYFLPFEGVYNVRHVEQDLAGPERALLAFAQAVQAAFSWALVRVIATLALQGAAPGVDLMIVSQAHRVAVAASELSYFRVLKG